MQKTLYNSPKQLKEFLTDNDLGMQKKFGQNFLIDENIRKLLINSIDENINNLASKKIWEIGPGLGAMTSMLLQTGAEITAFEIDRGFIKALTSFFSQNNNFKLIEGDVLKTWQQEIKKSGKPDVFFGNLPYNIASILIADTIEKGVIFNTAVFTVQKEVALRMSATCGTNYSSFSVLCQTFYDVKPIRNIPPQAFWPRPNVDSQAVLMKAKPDVQTLPDKQIFFSLLRGLFSSRRKTIKNNLTKWLKTNSLNLDATSILAQANYAENLRAENLTDTDFLHLAKTIENLKCDFN